MKQPSILIVGAGAMGLVAGYHFSLAGVRVTFLVRPGRMEAFSPPQQLYCYDDNTLKTFAGFHITDRVAALGGEPFDFIIVTLDGNTTRGAEATTMLRELGDAYRDTDTVFVMGGVGIGLREHYLRATRLPEQRLIGGFLGLLAHQSKAAVPLHAPTDPALLARSSIAYKHFGNKVGFLVETRNKPAARKLAALHNKSGVSRCSLIPQALVDIVTNSAFPMLGASDIAGWPDVATLVANKELWQLACKAQGEIAALPQHGWVGKLVSLLMTPGISARLQLKLEREILPLDYQGFNRFHHGGKVRAQDIEVMRNCLASGRQQGKPMPALNELLARLDAKTATT